MNFAQVEMISNRSFEAEIPLQGSPPLTLTQNFAFIVAFCVATLLTVPLLVAWSASYFLK